MEEADEVDESTDTCVSELNWLRLELLLLDEVAKEDGETAVCLRASMELAAAMLALPAADIKL